MQQQPRERTGAGRASTVVRRGWRVPDLVDARRIDALTEALPRGLYPRAGVVDRMTSRLPVLQGLVRDAAAVLHGSGAAGGRLRQALGWQLPPAPAELEIGPAGPSAVDADAMALLLAGAAWAARSPDEADAMISAAIRIVEPYAALSTVASGSLGPADIDAFLDMLGDVDRLHRMTAGLLAMPDDGPPLGPDDAPLGRFVPGLLEIPWRPKFLPPQAFDFLSPMVCPLRAAAKVYKLRQAADPYQITSITPGVVCPGRKPTTITITGTGFGAGGTVVFRSVNGPDVEIEVQPLTWSDTSVTVVVPQAAASGEVELRIPFGEFSLCGTTYPLYRLASAPAVLEADSAAYDLTVNWLRPPQVFDPDTDVTIRWKTSASPKTKVTINVTHLDLATGVVLVPTKTVHQSTGGGEGWVEYHLPPVGAAQTFRVELIAFNGCAESGRHYMVQDYTVAPRVFLKVYSLEVSQGYQHHPGGLYQDKQYAPFPSTELVVSIAEKDTIVRAYVGYDDSGLYAHTLPNVTGRLLVDGTPLLPIPQQPTVVAREYVFRRPIDSTLNFRIPAAMCNGTRKLVLKVWGTDAVGRDVTAQYAQQWTWTKAHALKVRWVKIVDTRNPPGSPPMTDAAGDELLLRAFDHLPSPATDIGRAVVPTIGSSKDPHDHGIEVGDVITGAGNLDGQADMWWNLDDVHDDADRDDEIWVGIVNESVGGKTNVGSYTVIAGSDPITIAHELGHSRDLEHVEGSCPWRGTPDDAIPLLPPGAFLVDVPIRVNEDGKGKVVTVDAAPGETLGDTMSYCCARATGPTTWTAIWNGLP